MRSGPAHAALRAAFLLSTSLRVSALSTNFNLTLTFSDPATLGTKPCNNPRLPDSAITFTTYWPANEPSDAYGYYNCFNINETFTSNATSQWTHTWTSNFTRIDATYSLSGLENYDSTANYSSVVYSQLGITSDHQGDTSEFAPRSVWLYGGQGCVEGIIDDGKDLTPSWTYSCRSRRECDTYPYPIKSFLVSSIESDQEKGKCDLDKEYGGAANALRVENVMLLAGLITVLASFVLLD